jgi:hypothetical protein
MRLRVLSELGHPPRELRTVTGVVTSAPQPLTRLCLKAPFAGLFLLDTRRGKLGQSLPIQIFGPFCNQAAEDPELNGA